MNYIDIFVAAVPTANRASYMAHANTTTPTMPFDRKRMIFGGFQTMLES